MSNCFPRTSKAAFAIRFKVVSKHISWKYCLVSKKKYNVFEQTYFSPSRNILIPDTIITKNCCLDISTVVKF